MSINESIAKCVSVELKKKLEYCHFTNFDLKNVFDMGINDFVFKYCEIYSIKIHTIKESDINNICNEVISTIFYIFFLHELIYMMDNVKKEIIPSRDTVLRNIGNIFRKDKYKVIIEEFLHKFFMEKKIYNMAIKYNFFSCLEKQIPKSNREKIKKYRNGIIKGILNTDKNFAKAVLVSNPIGLAVFGGSKIFGRKKVTIKKYIDGERFEKLIKSLITSKIIEQYFLYF